MGDKEECGLGNLGLLYQLIFPFIKIFTIFFQYTWSETEFYEHWRIPAFFKISPQLISNTKILDSVLDLTEHCIKVLNLVFLTSQEIQQQTCTNNLWIWSSRQIEYFQKIFRCDEFNAIIIQDDTEFSVLLEVSTFLSS